MADTQREPWRAVIAAVLLLLSTARIAVAGPPFLTDDPVPVELKHWEFYLASQVQQTADGRAGTLPQIEFNYGALPDLQLHVMGAAAFDRPNGAPSAAGAGDTEVGAKYRFVHESARVPQVATFPAVELPTGEARRGLGNGKAQAFLPVWLQKSWGAWTTYGGGGYWINPGAGNKNWIFTGWLLQRDVSGAVTLGAEVFHRTPDTVDAESGSGFNAGGQVNLSDHWHVLFSAGKDFSGPVQFTRYVALQGTF